MAPVNVADYERLAEEALEPGIFGYIAGGANDEWTLRENVAAFGRWVLRPRVLVDVETVTTATTVLGEEIALPVLVAPTAYQRLMHPDGELATARAAAAAGTVFCHSTLSSVRPADVGRRAARRPPLVPALLVEGSRVHEGAPRRGGRERLLGVVLTVDLPHAGRRERDLRTAFLIPPDLPLPCISMNFDRPVDPGTGLGDVTDRSLTWRDLEWLHATSRLPLLVKGILTREDAELACEHGARGVVVSNHGGRQLDGVPAALDALPEVVEAVDGRAEVLLDGGVRRGGDVLKALALGARATLVGRAALFGLGAARRGGRAPRPRAAARRGRARARAARRASPDAVARAHVAPAPR